MPRTILAALVACLAALLFLVSATSAAPSGSSGAKLRGRVAATFPASHLIRVDSRRLAHILQVPGSQTSIRVGQRVELRGTTLRRHGHGSRVLARNVHVVRSAYLRASSPVTGGSLAPTNDDELEVKGTLTALSPVTVSTTGGSAVCTAPAGMSLSGFAVGDFVELTCDLRAGVWTVRKLKHEDDDAVRGDDDDEDDDNNSGPGSCDDDDDHDHSASGSCDDDDHDDNSGPGNGDDDDDDDDSGRGGRHGGDDD
jgi:hypothetical protein